MSDIDVIFFSRSTSTSRAGFIVHQKYSWEFPMTWP